MANFWKSDSCYAQYGVDGTQCSFLRYLGEVRTRWEIVSSVDSLTFFFSG